MRKLLLILLASVVILLFGCNEQKKRENVFTLEGHTYSTQNLIVVSEKSEEVTEFAQKNGFNCEISESGGVIFLSAKNILTGEQIQQYKKALEETGLCWRVYFDESIEINENQGNSE